MKILFLTSYPDSWPYIPELAENLSSHGCEVDIFDVKTMSLITDRGNWSLVPKRWEKIILSSSVLARIFRSYGLLCIAWHSLSGFYDVVNIHILAPYYVTIAPFIKNKCRKFIITVWGSEFLRASSLQKWMQRYIVPYADAISFNNPTIEKKFIDKFKPKNTIILRFGFKSLQKIDSISQLESLQESCARLGIQTDRIIVALGYNAVIQQQHLAMINAAEDLTDEAKNRYFFVIPMTYPKNAGYLREIHQGFVRAGLSGKIFSDFMSMEDMCRLRRICSIAINVQKTDSFSASVQEHIYCGAVMIVGDWLPYGTLSAKGIKMISIPTCDYITTVLERLAKKDITVYKNNDLSRKAVKELSSWEVNIKKWIEAYGR